MSGKLRRIRQSQNSSSPEGGLFVIITKFDSRHLLASVKLTGGNFQLMSSFPGYSKWEGRSKRFRITSANIEHILINWPDADWGECEGHRQKYHDMKEEEAQNIIGKSAPLPSDDPFPYKTQPYDHQRRAFHISRDKKSYALFMEQGTGKTKVIIDTAAYLHSNGQLDTLIIIGPNGVHANWVVNEIPKHMPEHVEYRMVAYSSNLTKKKKSDIDEVYDYVDGLRIIAINVEGFASSKAKLVLEGFLKLGRCMLVIDESSRIKTPSAKRTKYLIKTKAAYKRTMTGTPITKGVENLYSQFLFLDKDILGFDTYTTFKSRYCNIIKTDNGGEMIVGYRNEDEIAKKIEGHSFRVLKSECLDLPEKIYKKMPVELSLKQRSMYDDLLDECMIEIEEGVMTVDLAIVKLLRLQQIICGWFKPDEGKEVVPIEPANSRIQALKAVLSDVEGKVIIWARFIADLRLIKKTLPNSILYSGDIEQANEFQDNDEVTYFIANPASAGLGLTLTAAETSVYYSNSFDLEHRMQSEDRNHRIGTKNNVNYIDLITAGTVDVKIVQALRSKKLVSDRILQDPYDFFMNYD